jgi:peptide-methionine (R)-S-oxide reductase
MSESDKAWDLTDAEWQARLTPEQYRVTRLGGTERPHSGEYCELFAPGTYHCVCCDAELFEADSKFRSGCGWPSFDASRDGSIEYLKDTSHGMIRTEVRCARCGAHLGHVFPDGPTSTGTRYCINSVAVVHRTT